MARLTDSGPILNFESCTKVHTGNSMIDSLLNYKYSIASNRGIEIDYVTEIPSNLPFCKESLCIILGNALDNAIESTEHFNGKKLINVSLLFKKNCLCITIRNPYDHPLKSDLTGILLTTKPKDVLHGIGLTSIQSALDALNGSMFIDTNNHIFTIKFVLYSK